MEVVNTLILLHSSEIHLYSLLVALYIGTVCKINIYSSAVWYLKHIIVIIMLLIIIIIDFFYCGGPLVLSVQCLQGCWTVCVQIIVLEQRDVIIKTVE